MISRILYRYNFLFVALCVVFVFELHLIYVLYQSHGCTHPTPLVAFLDVGQGDAVYIQDKLGKSILIDTGPKDSGVLTRIQEVTHCDNVYIDALLLTHPDADHIGEAERLIEKGLVGEIIHNGFMDINQGDESLMENKLEKTSIPRKKVRAGDVLHLQNLDIGVLFPIDEPYKGTSKKKNIDDNLYSVVVKITSSSTTFLLTGDAPISVENTLMKTYQNILDVDVLKLGHHGSKNSSSQEFLSVTSPDEVVISAGKNNKYKHPNEETLQRVVEQQRKKPLKIRETFTEGNVMYEL